MEKDNGGGDNIVRMRIVRDSHYLPDGGSYLTDKLDPVLFVEYLKQKKTLEEVIAVNSKWHTQYEALQKLMKQWRFVAYLGCVVIFITVLLKIVKGG